MAGKVIPITYPTPAVRQVPEDVKNWDGFQGLPPAQRDWPTPFRSPGDWSSVAAKLDQLGPVDKATPQWKTKIFILTQADWVVQDANGLYYQKRHRLNQKQIDDLLRALARVPGYARAATDGAVNVSLDVVVDGELVVFEKQTLPPPLDFSRPLVLSNDPWPSNYLTSRTNHGAFVAEDKVFRGPYQTTLLLGPDSLSRVLSGEADGYGLEEVVAGKIAGDATSRWNRLGIYTQPNVNVSASITPPILPALFPPKAWEILASEEPDFEKLQELYSLADQAFGSSGSALFVPWRPVAYSGNVNVSIATDAERGSVLRYAENSPVRSGGFALPYRNIDPTQTPYLSFWVKTNSRDDLAIVAGVQNKGRFLVRQAIPAVAGGTWQQVVVDLRNINPRTMDDLSIGPASDGGERDQVGDILYFFDDFQLLAEAQPTPALPPSDVIQRATAAKTLSAADLAKETSDFVKLNGLLREGPFAAADEAGLIQLTKSINIRIAGEAVKKLAQLGTPTAKAEVMRLIVSSPFEYVKQCAAIEVGKFGDPQMAGLLSRLFASRYWQTRLAGARALTLLPGDEPAVISMTFLQEIDPQIRLTLTRHAHVQNSVVQKRLLWSTVNDPSDAVRAESAWRLITSGNGQLAAEGYKAIRDDSNWVRIDLLNRMRQNPAEAHRPALRLAVTDLSPRVRTAALSALATQPGNVDLEEVANTLQDKFPQVQLALIDLAKAKKLTLPASAIESLQASIDPRVVEKAKELGP